MTKYILFLIISSFTYSSFAVEFHGKVIDEKTKEVIVGATIRVIETNNGAYTNKFGYFNFKPNVINNKKSKILISYVGYANRIIDLKDTTLKYDYLPLNPEYKTRQEYKEARFLIVELKQSTFLTNEVIVSASKNIQAVQDVPISYSILKGQDFNLRNTKSLEKIIETVPGVEVVRDNISIRGTSGFSFGIGSRAALLLDGFPVLAGDNGDMKFEALPMFNIDRVEIIKGAGSALYGTSALGGVINVITQDITENKLSSRVFTNLFTGSRYDEWDFYSGIRSNTGFDVSLLNKISDNLNLMLTAGTLQKQSYKEGDAEETYTLFAKSKYRLNEESEVNLMYNMSLVDRDDFIYWQGLNRPFSNTSLPADRISSDKYSIFADYRNTLSETSFIVARVGSFYTTYSNNRAVTDSSYRQSDANALNIEIQYNNKLYSDLNLTSGINYQLNAVRSISFKNRNQGIASAYSQFEYTGIKDVIFTFGARLDREKTDTFSTNLEFNPKAGISYKLLNNLALRSSAGRGFRAPSIAEKFTSVKLLGFFVQESPNLLAEKSASYEIGMNYEYDFGIIKGSLDGSVFQNDLRDMIEPILDNNQRIQFVNLTRARIRGLEFSWRNLLFDFIGVETNVTLMDPLDLTDPSKEATLKYRARNLWYSRLIFPISKNLNFDLAYRYKTRIETYDIALGIAVRNADALVDMHVVDAIINYNLKEDIGIPLEATLSCFNVFDYYYNEMVGNIGPPRNFGLQIRYTY
jgi:iron complex outermembrane receptor protein